MEPGNRATTYKNVKYYIQQPTEMSNITYNNPLKCQLLHTPKPTEMSTTVESLEFSWNSWVPIIHEFTSSTK